MDPSTEQAGPSDVPMQDVHKVVDTGLSMEPAISMDDVTIPTTSLDKDSTVSALDALGPATEQPGASDAPMEGNTGNMESDMSMEQPMAMEGVNTSISSSDKTATAESLDKPNLDHPNSAPPDQTDCTMVDSPQSTMRKRKASQPLGEVSKEKKARIEAAANDQRGSTSPRAASVDLIQDGASRTREQSEAASSREKTPTRPSTTAGSSARHESHAGAVTQITTIPDDDSPSPNAGTKSGQMKKDLPQASASSVATDKKASRTAKAGSSAGKVGTKDKAQESEAEEDDAVEDAEESDEYEEPDEIVPPRNGRARAGNKGVTKTELNSLLATQRKEAKAELQKTKKHHEGQIQKLKAESKQYVDNLRKTFKTQAQGFRADKEKATKETREKHEQAIEDLKDRHDEALTKVKDRLAKVEKESKQRYDDLKAKCEEKLREKSRAFDDADHKRKELGKALKTERKDHDQEVTAMELKLKEEKKQFIREQEGQLRELKPEHSIAVKAKEKELKLKDQKIQQLETRLQQCKEDVRSTMEDICANEQRYTNRAMEIVQLKDKQQVMEITQADLERHLTAVEQRAKVDIAREQEKLEMERRNLQQQNQRLIDQQRATSALQAINDRQAQMIEMFRKGGKLLQEERDAIAAELARAKAQLQAPVVQQNGVRVAELDGEGVVDGDRFHTPPTGSAPTTVVQEIAGWDASAAAQLGSPIQLD